MYVCTAMVRGGICVRGMKLTYCYMDIVHVVRTFVAPL